MPRYELSDGKSNKFWTIEIAGSSLTTTYGRIGTDGRSVTKRFASAEAAKRKYDKLIAEKTRKGYVLASAGVGASTSRGGDKNTVAGERRVAARKKPVAAKKRPRGKGASASAGSVARLALGSAGRVTVEDGSLGAVAFVGERLFLATRDATHERLSLLEYANRPDGWQQVGSWRDVLRDERGVAFQPEILPWAPGLVMVWSDDQESHAGGLVDVENGTVTRVDSAHGSLYCRGEDATIFGAYQKKIVGNKLTFGPTRLTLVEDGGAARPVLADVALRTVHAVFVDGAFWVLAGRRREPVLYEIDRDGKVARDIQLPDFMGTDVRLAVTRSGLVIGGPRLGRIRGRGAELELGPALPWTRDSKLVEVGAGSVHVRSRSRIT